MHADYVCMRKCHLCFPVEIFRNYRDMLPPKKKKKNLFFFKFQKLRLKLKSVSKANTKPVLRSFQCHGAQTAVLGLRPC